MRKLILAILLFAAPCFAQGVITGPTKIISNSTGGGGTFTDVQFVDNSAAVCTGGGINSCALTVSATGAGNLGHLTVDVVGGAASPPNTSITSISDGSSVWSVCSNCFKHSTGTIGTAQNFSSDMGYSLSLAAGKTTITATINTTLSAGSNNFIYVSYIEKHWSGSSISVDPGATPSGSQINATGTSAPGVALTISGTTDVIIQAVIDDLDNNGFGGITGGAGYTHPTPNFAFGAGPGGAINTSNGAAPTWTGQTSDVSISNAMAFKGN